VPYVSFLGVLSSLQELHALKRLADLGTQSTYNLRLIKNRGLLAQEVNCV